MHVRVCHPAKIVLLPTRLGFQGQAASHQPFSLIPHFTSKFTQSENELSFIHFQIFTAAQVDLEDAEGLTPLMHGLLAVRSSMDSESAVRAVSVLAQHSKPGSLQSQQDGVGATTCVDKILFVFLVQLPAGCPPSRLPGQLGSGGEAEAYQPIRADSCSPRRPSQRCEELLKTFSVSQFSIVQFLYLEIRKVPIYHLPCEELAGAAGRPQCCRAWHRRDARTGSSDPRVQGIKCS